MMKKIRETILGVLLLICSIVSIVSFVLGNLWPKTEFNWPWLISVISLCITVAFLKIF